MASKKNARPAPANAQAFPVVGIGASAGGLDAFRRLLKAIPENSGMAYVLVQHLDPSHESVLPDLLSKIAKVPVVEITDDIKLSPDRIFILPPNKILTVNDGGLRLSPRDANRVNLPIDVFFSSLAEVYQSFAVGVVLSGTGSDGSKGLKAVKENGGITFAQDVKSAGYGGMPQSAIDANVVDFVLPPEKIPEQLLKVGNLYKGNLASSEQDQLPKDEEDVFRQILSIIRHRCGADFSYYKKPTLRRRVVRRMAIAKIEKLADYLVFLKDDKTEQDALFQDILIPVTSFFRDPKTFQEIHDAVFPFLLKNKSGNEPIRIWIAGCSTGEEAYSVAITLREFLGEKLSGMRVQIFATDISEKAISKARTGIYSRQELEGVSEERLKNYFNKTDGDYHVNKLIRDTCVFAIHNFLKDPPFAKIDFICCRNVFIYMEAFLQKRALTNFHYALRDKGLLLLGKSESTSAAPELFTPFSNNDKVFSRKAATGHFVPATTLRSEGEASPGESNGEHKQDGKQPDFQKNAYEILLSKYTPAGVVVNEHLDIVYFHGTTGAYFDPAPGKPSLNVLKLAREGLSFELRNALHKAKTTQATIVKADIPINGGGTQKLVTIEVIPLANTIDPHFLIPVFDNFIKVTMFMIDSQLFIYFSGQNWVSQVIFIRFKEYVCP